MRKHFPHGFLVVIIDGFIKLLQKFSIVEIVKTLIVKLSGAKKIEDIKWIANIAIDTFITLKFLLLIYIWIFLKNNWMLTIFIVYLLFMNNFTYFYYHIWIPQSERPDFEKMKRRFISLIISLVFSVIGYAYLYAVPLKYMFDWKTSNINSDAIFLSTANTIFMDYPNVLANQPISTLLVQSQWVLTFIFVAVILASSIPQHNK